MTTLTTKHHLKPGLSYLRKIVATLAIIAPLLLLTTGQESRAHGKDLNTTPADGSTIDEFPETIEIIFNEKVTILEKSTMLVNSSGENTILLAKAEDYNNGSKIILNSPTGEPSKGWYAVNWRAISADSHPIAGTFTFFYGDPALSGSFSKIEQEANPAELYIYIATLLRIFAYISLLLSLGATAFLWVVGDKTTEVYTKAGKHALRVGLTAAIAGFVTTLLLLVNTSIILNGGSFTSLGLIIQIVAAGPIGSALLIRVSALFGILTGLLLLSEKSLKKLGVAVFATSSFFYIYSYAMSSHVYVVPLKWLAVSGLILHLIGASIWLGGIPSLALALRNAGKDVGDHSMAVVNSAKLSIVDRFSKIATLAVVCVGVGGLLASFTMFNNLSEYYTTNYGRVLLFKIVLVSCAGAVGAYNHFVLVPMLRKEPDNEKTQVAIKKSVTKELFIFLMIILATGALTYNSAPKAGGNHFSGHSGGGHMGTVNGGELASRLDPTIVRIPVAAGEIQIEYYPGESTVENTFKATLTSSTGLNVQIVQASLRFERADLQISGLERTMTVQNGLLPTLVTRDLGVAGSWDVQITLTTVDGDLIQAPFSVEVTDTLSARKSK